MDRWKDNIVHTLIPASLLASATPISASLLTLAVCVLPRESRYCTWSTMSLIVKLRISIPILPTSGDATSLTREAKASRSKENRETESLKCNFHPDWEYLVKND